MAATGVVSVQKNTDTPGFRDKLPDMVVLNLLNELRIPSTSPWNSDGKPSGTMTYTRENHVETTTVTITNPVYGIDKLDRFGVACCGYTMRPIDFNNGEYIEVTVSTDGKDATKWTAQITAYGVQRGLWYTYFLSDYTSPYDWMSNGLEFGLNNNLSRALSFNTFTVKLVTKY